MKTVHEVSKLAGVSIRTLHYYDTIGLLHPTSVTEAGYRLYDDTALERLQHIMLFRELEFPLGEIKRILGSRNFDKDKALQQQIELLTLKKERLQDLIDLAYRIKTIGVNTLDFKAFDTKKIDEYAAQAKLLWGNTDAYKEFEDKQKNRSEAETYALGKKFMELFAEFGALKDSSPDSDAAQQQVKKLQAFITEHYYTCTPEILSSLGQTYAAGGSMSENIDAAGGKGTAEFAAKVIKIYCGK